MSNMKLEALIAAGDQQTITLALTALHAVTTRADAEIQHLAETVLALDRELTSRCEEITQLAAEVARLKKEGGNTQ